MVQVATLRMMAAPSKGNGRTEGPKGRDFREGGMFFLFFYVFFCYFFFGGGSPMDLCLGGKSICETQR